MGIDFESLLDLARELESYSGYMSSADKRARDRLRQKFDQRRREIVYSLLREGPSADYLALSVGTRLNAIKARANYDEATIDFVRRELERHIAKQGAAHPVLRFGVRWAAPAAAVAWGLIHLYPLLRNLFPGVWW